MSRASWSRLAPVAVLAVLLFSLAGCWNPFAPDEGGGGPPTQVQYKVRSTCDNVLYNLETAYEYMNLNEYVACLSESLVFHPNPADVNDPENPLPEKWYKQDEVDIHRGMFEGNDDQGPVDDISLNLTVTSFQFVPGPDPGSSLDDGWKYICSVDLRVTIGEWIYVATAPAEFLFKIDPDEVGPESETLWEIVHWWDRDPDTRGREASEPGEERTSFSRIKARFL
jgi:hypothetical protein